MHPHTYYATLFSHKKRDEVFVIMSFAPEFDDRWLNVLEPTIRDDLQLKPHRVDYNLSGESIVHDILDGIAHARLVIADITCSPMTDGFGTVWPQRNGNVMWEVGIAHVMRMPDEVVLVRSDNEPSIFDLTQFRAFPYDPSNVPDARRFLAALARDRLKAIDMSLSDHVRRCAESLDQTAMNALINGVPFDQSPFEILPNTINALSFTRLFELGILKSSITVSGPQDQVQIRTVATLTDFGKAVAVCIVGQAKPRLGGLPVCSSDKSKRPAESVQ